MDAVAATEYVEDQAMALSAEEFELLCESVLTESLPPARFSVTAFRQDGGIDIDGSVQNSLLDISLGVQVKQYTPTNTVGSPEIQRFQGALADTGCDTGTVITTSSFTDPATESAARAGIHLVNGSALFESMIELQVGVRRGTELFEPDDTFWKLFGKPDETGPIPSKRIPLANSFDTLDAVLAAIRDTRGTKDDIVATADVSPRHADLYATAGWILGFVHQEWPDDEKHKKRRWSLNRTGARYVAYRVAGLNEEAENLLLDAIRDTEMISCLTGTLRESGSLRHSSLIHRVETESELSHSSAERRASSLGVWLARLPEVSVENGREKTYSWQEP
ncbi:restriction endonuclease [Haloferax mediterranei ATCC 33500]|uniref:Mrr restriction system protein n=1 Tax=Haloferax mediterranei (strain ATCC 33500 / DSM 1411 / JCM 8866 / NBRC 14739 / NCIMB 2177 / R-4) TaxID=523841 RepID=I3R2A7_HALMT|nr:restriction endonuclease [Haloferax mediterranei]AFK18367.1 mrr restriction system protein [Haloferax mediterranei ATCC 33500]AHZ22237.1 restriction endonuclease [Haloferax mediterranei ATCC 33500]EMA02359.1 mrr restriction system protein [Haloferax mediterranei ATCC 33500]MDX5988458.1 restriction endonuclease [Haloferax mediterranei ATCC 33500]QCQ74878.1 restriction endonuclease [Haloferax mediterranei ATCC 33500]